MESKNQEVLDSLRDFCLEHPELRFWQAVRAWAGVGFILTANSQDIVSDVFSGIQDTFYFEGRIN